MRALIFGANGQDGGLLSKLYEGCVCLSHSDCDVSDYETTSTVIKRHKPDVIFNLAARSTTRHAALFDNHKAIAMGALNVLEAVKVHSPHSKVFIAGSGLQFRNDHRPIHERDPFEARDSYSAARIYAAYLARYYRTLGIKTYVGYLFHHESGRRQASSVSQLVLNAARRIAQGSTEKLEIGNLGVFKEWSYAGDVVKGIKMLVEQEEVMEAVIGSGVGYTIEEWVRLCFEHFHLNYKDHVITTATFKPEYVYLISNPTTMNGLDWKCEVDLQGLLKCILQP
jgi:GDPmannose 4,6-dehydratase